MNKADYHNHLCSLAVESRKPIVLFEETDKLEAELTRFGIKFEKTTTKKKTVVDTDSLPSDEALPLIEAQEAYSLIVGKEKFDKIPKRYSNDVEWLLGKIKLIND